MQSSLFRFNLELNLDPGKKTASGLHSELPVFNSDRSTTVHCVSFLLVDFLHVVNSVHLFPVQQVFLHIGSVFVTHVCNAAHQNRGIVRVMFIKLVVIVHRYLNGLSTSPFTVSRCPSRDISVPLSEIYCKCHVTDSARATTWLSPLQVVPWNRRRRRRRKQS